MRRIFFMVLLGTLSASAGRPLAAQERTVFGGGAWADTHPDGFSVSEAVLAEQKKSGFGDWLTSGVTSTAGTPTKAKEEAKPATTPSLVGQLGRSDRIVVKGSHAFSHEEIVQALALDPQVLLASLGTGRLSAYLNALQEKTELGYQRAGFAHAQVRVELEQRHGEIVLMVSEGPRYTSGDVKIVGAKSLDADLLRLALVSLGPSTSAVTVGPEPCPPTAAPAWIDKKFDPVTWMSALWTPDEPAPFDAVFAASVRQQLQRACARQGYPAARLRAEVVPRDGKPVADLLITLEAEGPAAGIDVFEISGKRTAVDDAILKFLDLQAGVVWTATERERVERVLWQSGRFLKYDFELWPSAQPGSPTRLLLNLVQSDDARPLDAPLPATQQAMLRLRRWLLEFGDRGDDLVVDCQNLLFTGRLVISPQGSLLARAKTTIAGDLVAKVDYGLLMSPERIAAVAFDRQRMLSILPPGSPAYVAFKFLPVLDDSKQQSHWTFGLYGTADDGGQAGQRRRGFYAMIAPAAVLQAWRDARAKIENGQLHVSADGLTCRSDAATGELLEWTHFDHKEGMILSLKSEHGAWSRELKELDRKSAGFVEDARLGQPLSSVARFACDEPLLALVLGHAPSKAAGDAVRKILDAGALEPLDRLLGDVVSRHDGEFTIPLEASKPAKDTDSLVATVLWAMRVADMLPQLFPVDSWPYLQIRELLLPAAKGVVQTDPEPARQFEMRQFGPIGHLAVAGNWERTSLPAALLWARSGFTQLAMADFRRDLHLLMNIGYVPGQCCWRLAEAVRTLDDAQLEALADSYAPQYCERVLAVLHQIKHDRRPAGEVLADSLERLWRTDWHALVERQLTGIEARGLADRARGFAARGLLDRALADLNQALAHDEHLESALALRAWVVRQKGDYRQSLADYRQVLTLDPKHDYAWNACAWLLATCPDASLRSGTKAVEAATRACELTDWKRPEYLATLAAAFAEAGDFAAALEWQLCAEERSDAESRARLRERETLFEGHRAVRDEALRR